MGLLPGLEPMFRIRLLSGERAAAAMGWDVAVRLANGFSSLDCVDIISTSIRICPIKSLKSENTVENKRVSINCHFILSRFWNYSSTKTQLLWKAQKITDDPMLLLLIIKVGLSVPLGFPHPAVELGKLCHKEKHTPSPHAHT